MADSMATRAEAGILLFATQLESSCHSRAPEGLLRLLRQFKPKTDESAEEMRRRIYRRFFGIMWITDTLNASFIHTFDASKYNIKADFLLLQEFGSKIGKDSFEGTQPTYVYPPEMKAVIRAVIPEAVKDYMDPSGPKVYKVTLQDLVITKWPAARKNSHK